MRDDNFNKWLVAGLAVHGLLAVTLGVLPKFTRPHAGPSLSSTKPSPPLSLVDIEVLSRPAPQTAPAHESVQKLVPQPPPPDTSTHSSHHGTAHRHATSAGPSDKARRPLAQSSDEGTSEGSLGKEGQFGEGTSQGTSREAADGSQWRGKIDLGLGPKGIWRWVDPKKLAKGQRGMGYSSTGGLQEALDARDHRLGLGPGGTIASLARSAMNTPGAPQLGEVIVDVLVGPDGRVARVSLVSRHIRGSNHLLQALRSMLAGRRLRIPATATRGMAVRIALVAKSTLPSGAANGAPVRRDGAGARFDVSDIGAAAVRSVHVRVLSQRRL